MLITYLKKHNLLHNTYDGKVFKRNINEHYYVCQIKREVSFIYDRFFIITWLYMVISVHNETFKLTKVEKTVLKYIFYFIPYLNFVTRVFEENELKLAT